MQYSPNNFVFTISMVDAGTADMIRGLGKNIVSAADLIAQFEATLTDEQIKSHFAARDVIDAVTAEAFKEIGRRVRSGGTHEHEIQQFFMEAFAAREHGDRRSADRRRERQQRQPALRAARRAVRCRFAKATSFCWTCGRRRIRRARFITTSRGWDSWARLRSDRQREIFKIVSEARDIGVKTVQDAIAAGKPIAGWEVDHAVRGHIKKAKYGDYFIHRTGHSIGTEVHANGANMDDLEIHDERRILPNSCFSIEPGIYLPEFGVRLEVDVLVRPGSAEVTGKIQREIVTI